MNTTSSSKPRSEQLRAIFSGPDGRPPYEADFDTTDLDRRANLRLLGGAELELVASFDAWRQPFLSVTDIPVGTNRPSVVHIISLAELTLTAMPDVEGTKSDEQDFRVVEDSDLNDEAAPGLRIYEHNGQRRRFTLPDEGIMTVSEWHDKRPDESYDDDGYYGPERTAQLRDAVHMTWLVDLALRGGAQLPADTISCPTVQF